MALAVGERDERLRFRTLAGEDEAERPELRKLQLLVPHRENLGRIVLDDDQLHGAAKVSLERLRQHRVGGRELGGILVRLDAEANAAARARDARGGGG